MNERGQGTLEYLLLTGGSILVALVVISILVSLTGGEISELNEEFNAEFFCNSHGMELIDFESDYGRLEEVKCFKENESLKVFKVN